MAKLNEETRYRLQKRINELREERNSLQSYRYVALQIFDAAAESNGSVSSAWILKHFRNLLK